MKVLLTKALLVSMMQSMADFGQDEFLADVEEVKDNRAVLRYAIEGGKLIPYSESENARNTESPAEQAPPDSDPGQPTDDSLAPATTEQVPAPDTSDPAALLKLTTDELKVIAESMGLPTDCKKPELVNSIVAKSKGGDQNP